MKTLDRTRTTPLKHQFIEELIQYELQNHDWTFNYSDDHGYWSAGISQQKRIKELVEDAYKMNFDPADIFYKFYPYEGCDPASHYGIKRSWEEQLDKRAKEMADE